MNPIIQKCVEELNKETPRLDYIRGMLESVLLSSEPFPRASTLGPGSTNTYLVAKPAYVEPLSDEQKSIVDTYERGPIGKIA